MFVATLVEDARSQLLDVLEGTRGIEAFEDWFVGQAWDADSTPWLAALDHLLAERALMDEPLFRSELLDLVGTVDQRHETIAAGEPAVTTVIEQLIVGDRTITRSLAIGGTPPEVARA